MLPRYRQLMSSPSSVIYGIGIGMAIDGNVGEHNGWMLTTNWKDSYHDRLRPQAVNVHANLSLLGHSTFSTILAVADVHFISGGGMIWMWLFV